MTQLDACATGAGGCRYSLESHKVWLGKLTALNLTPFGGLDRKTATQTKHICAG